MSPEVILALFIGLAASIEDLIRRQISNWIPIAAILGGLAIHFYDRGFRGAGFALLGAVTGFCVFLVFYILGGMGGGDVKLMAGFGAVLGGASNLLSAALWTAGIGGILALFVVLGRRLKRLIFRRATEDKRPGSEAIPYAPAIALGVWMSLLGRSI